MLLPTLLLTGLIDTQCLPGGCQQIDILADHVMMIV